jgi:hypothetical protein
MVASGQIEKTEHDPDTAALPPGADISAGDHAVDECQKETVKFVRWQCIRNARGANSSGRDCVVSRNRSSSLRKRNSAEFVMYIPMVGQPGRIWALAAGHRDSGQAPEKTSFLTKSDAVDAVIEMVGLGSNRVATHEWRAFWRARFRFEGGLCAGI